MTLTAPGADVLPWDESACVLAPGHRHSGKFGCRVDSQAAARWHRTKGQAWTHFMTDLRRLLQHGEKDDVQFFRGTEPQHRGVMHDHVLVRCRGDIVRLWAKVRDLAVKHGFGTQFDLRWMRRGDEGYIAKYATDAANELPNVAWEQLDRETGELVIVRGAQCRAWTASRRWGLTMKELRRQQAAWVRASASGQGDAGRGARQGEAGVPPLDRSPDPSRSGPLDPYTDSYAPDDGGRW